MCTHTPYNKGYMQRVKKAQPWATSPQTSGEKLFALTCLHGAEPGLSAHLLSQTPPPCSATLALWLHFSGSLTCCLFPSSFLVLVLTDIPRPGLRACRRVLGNRHIQRTARNKGARIRAQGSLTWELGAASGPVCPRASQPSSACFCSRETGLTAVTGLETHEPLRGSQKRLTL